MKRRTETKLSQVLSTSLSTAALGLGVFGMLSVVTPAPSVASDTALELGNERVTAVPMQRYEREAKIVRDRSVGKHSVTFSAMPEAIDDGAVVVFEIESVSSAATTPRWRCVAEHNVSECFQKPVRIKYLDDDRQVVMKVRVEVGEPQPVADVLARR